MAINKSNKNANGQDTQENRVFQLEAELKERYKRGKIILLAYVLLSVVTFLRTILKSPDSEMVLNALNYLYTWGLFFLGVILFWEEKVVGPLRKEIQERKRSQTQEQAQEDPFKNAIKTSYTYLDRYYDQTQKQAQQGFYVTIGVAFLGAILIGVGIRALFQEKIEPAYITCGAGAIIEFISAVFFYLYNKTITSMNSYHDKLVLSQNVAFALRVASEVDDKAKQDDAKLAIIKELVKDVNAQMMKSDNDDTEPHKKQPSNAEKPSDTGTQS